MGTAMYDHIDHETENCPSQEELLEQRQDEVMALEAIMGQAFQKVSDRLWIIEVHWLPIRLQNLSS